MSSIDDYREAKANFLRLQTQAKKDLLARFRQLEAEMSQIQRELREDFGVKINANLKAKTGRPKPGATTESTPTPTPTPSPKIAALEKRVAAEKRKLEQAVKAGKPDKAIKDRIYELEDDLRLAREAS